MLENKNLNLLQFSFEILIILGYIIGIKPFGYYATFWFVIPLVVINLVIALTKNPRTVVYTSVNLVCSILTFLPVIGYLFIFLGIGMSSLSAISLSKTFQDNIFDGLKVNQKKDKNEKIVDVKVNTQPNNENDKTNNTTS